MSRPSSRIWPRSQALDAGEHLQRQRFAGARRADDGEPARLRRPRHIELEIAEPLLQLQREIDRAGFCGSARGNIGHRVRQCRRAMPRAAARAEARLPASVLSTMITNGKRQRRHQHRQHRRQALRAERDIGVNRQRIGMIGDHHGGAEFAEGAQPRQQQSGQDRRPGDRHADVEEDVERAAPERRGDAFEPRVHRGEGRARGDDQKRRGDENFGDHDAGERVGQRAAGEPSDRRRIADQKQQQDAARQRRQRERQLDQKAEQSHGAARHPRQQITERNAAERDQ